MGEVVRVFVVPLIVLLGGCGGASSQPTCSDPQALDFLRKQLDRPFNEAKTLLGAIQIPVPAGLRYDLTGMAAVDATGLQITCSAEAVVTSGDGEAYGTADVLYTLVRNDAGGLNIRMQTDALGRIQEVTHTGVMLRAVRRGEMRGQSGPTSR